MRLIVNGTLGVSRQIREAGPNNVPPAQHEHRMFGPGEEFDSQEWGISDQEAGELIRDGRASRRTRQVPDDGQATPVATAAPRLPASGATEAPDPNAVADRAMSGEFLDQFRERTAEPTPPKSPDVARARERENKDDNNRRR